MPDVVSCLTLELCFVASVVFLWRFALCGFIASTRSSCLGRKTNFRRTIKVINQLASRQADRQTDGPTDGQSASRTCSSMQPERRTSWSWCLEDTCRVPCSATWPCSAACTPAGCQPAGRPRSGPGRSVSVHGGSGPGSTTWLVEGGGLLCPLLLFLSPLPPVTGLPLLIRRASDPWLLSRG